MGTAQRLRVVDAYPQFRDRGRSLQCLDYRASCREIVCEGQWCHLAQVGGDRGLVEETVTEWREGEHMVLSINPLEKAPPFKQAHGRLAVQEEGTGTRVSMTVEYTLKFGWLGKLMDALIVGPQMQKVIPSVLLGLKHYTQTGEEVTPEVLRRIRHTSPSAQPQRSLG